MFDRFDPVQTTDEIVETVGSATPVIAVVGASEIENASRTRGSPRTSTFLPDLIESRSATGTARTSGMADQDQQNDADQDSETSTNSQEDQDLGDWLGGRDSNPDTVVQRRRSRAGDVGTCRFS
jgi:hypothetical protein